MFFIFRAAFWWAVLGESSDRARGWAMLFIFTTMIHTGALGALMRFALIVRYPPYINTTSALGLAPLEDQQLGGLVMWIPAGFAYLCAGPAIGAHWLSGQRARLPQ
jgi:cytochrome c oxidase assembly factor CtaG